MNKKIILILIILLLIFKKFYKKENIINAGVAKTSKEIQQGLMFIKEPLPENEGMIFYFQLKIIIYFG